MIGFILESLGLFERVYGLPKLLGRLLLFHISQHSPIHYFQAWIWRNWKQLYKQALVSRAIF